ncbi:MAG: ABC transporter ATP-binding protein [Erythrobacter sp.]
MTAEPAIRIDNLAKRYAPPKGAKGEDADGKLALKGISFDVPQGSIFGLLGPNGAGKSTLINILAGLVNKTGGKVEIWGFDIDRQRRNASRSIGIVPQEIVFDPFFTPYEVLENQGGFYGIAGPDRRSEALLEAVRLSDKRDAYARTLSGGMKRRLLVAKAMVHSPPILVLDEPTAGVDVELRRQLWDLVLELNHSGVTVVLTTHYLEEAEELCDRIAIINHGELIANKPTRDLIAMAREKVIELTVDADPSQAVIEGAFTRDFITRNEVLDDRRIALTYDRDLVSAGQMLNHVQEMGFTVEDVTTREADLEDVFVQLTSASQA